MAFKEYKYCIRPEPNTVIWRYMSLDKFESMLDTRALFFCRADRFSDPYEGSITRRVFENRSTNFRNFFPQKAKENENTISTLHKSNKKLHIINCWHINNSENDSMWKLYLKSNEGIAIKTTIAKLLKSFYSLIDDIFCSKIRYLDYEKEYWYDKDEYPFWEYNMFIPLVHKRIEFKQEAEIRLIHKVKVLKEIGIEKYWNQRPIEKGKFISADIEHLIENIYCPPTSDSNQIKKVEELISKYDFRFKVKKSKLSKEPYY